MHVNIDSDTRRGNRVRRCQDSFRRNLDSPNGYRRTITSWHVPHSFVESNQPACSYVESATNFATPAKHLAALVFLRKKFDESFENMNCIAMIRNTIRNTLPCLFMLLLTEANAFAQEVARWSFERTDVATPNEKIDSKRSTSAALSTTAMYSDDCPGAFVYDPLTKRSRSNAASGRFDGSERKSNAVVINLGEALKAKQSLTIEAFVKPSPQAGGDAWLVGKSRTLPSNGELALNLVYLQNANQTWHGAEVSTHAGSTERFAVGHYSSSTRLDPKVRAWRHMAISYDAATKVVTAWVDYHLSHSITLEKPLSWDEGSFLIGGRPDHWGASALIDEVRIVDKVLGPAEFQRARADEISDVSFVSTQQVVPRDAGCLDAKENFGAVGDGRTDDTAALNAAFDHLASRVPLAYNTLIIPPGVYLVSKTLHCSRFIDVKGAGPDKTILRLKDAQFSDTESPQPVLRMSSTNGPPGSNSGVNGSSISLYLEGITIDTGRKNPGAKALEYHSNNLGRLENMVLRSGDGIGVLGLDLNHHDVGPALIKNVQIDGFDSGVSIRYQEYSMTFEDLRLKGQRVVGIRNQGNILAIRKLKSINSVPAIISEGANSMVALLDSSLQGGSSKQPAIRSEGALYCLRVKTSGYSSAIEKRILTDQKRSDWKEETIAGLEIDEYIGDKIIMGHGSATGAIKLPIKETPEPSVPPVSEWVNVLKFRSHEVDNDFSPAVQAAIDSGAKVVYIPANERLSFRTPIRLHAPLERLIGFGGELNWASDVWKESRDRNQTETDGVPPALLIYDEPNPNHTLVLDRIGCVHVQHASAATLVLRSSTPNRYTTTVGGGQLFGEDIGGADWHFDHPQSVWVRQWNPESHATGPCIHSQGATIWSLGFKTEYESQKLLAEAGASTEILGGFIYPIGEIPRDRPAFENRDSRMALIYGASIYRANHEVHIRDTHASQTKDFGGESLNWAGSRARIDLFRSEP